MATFPELCLQAAGGAQLSLGVQAFQHSPQAVQTWCCFAHLGLVARSLLLALKQFLALIVAQEPGFQR